MIHIVLGLVFDRIISVVCPDERLYKVEAHLKVTPQYKLLKTLATIVLNLANECENLPPGVLETVHM